ncbi:PHP domain-containing protein [Candidatus Woesearchaeota archaeon]|nr:PHP domain-containing protein [Candidatus Woesearchaeota archaeon]
MLKSKNKYFLVQKTPSFLKADLHTHTREDPYDRATISHTAKDLVRFAAKKGFKVLSITNHHSVYFNRQIKSFAKKKGILLIPGAEPRIKGKDVVLVNIKKDDLRRIRKLEHLEKFKDSALIIAPHPFFFKGECLGNYLIKYIDSFHAIEYSHFYTKFLTTPVFRFLDGNRKAEKIAKKYKKPLIGTSDAHRLYEFNKTYTLVNSAKNKDDVIEAVKKNRIRLVTRPMTTVLFFRRTLGFTLKSFIPETLRLKRKVPEDFQDFFQKI